MPRLLGRGMTMGDQLARHARTSGEQVGFCFDGVRRTYREFDERVSRLARALRDRGVGRGDRIVVLGLNTLEVLETYFASTRLGAIPACRRAHGAAAVRPVRPRGGGRPAGT
jgi:fatty-acyl-CoA synthase